MRKVFGVIMPNETTDLNNCEASGLNHFEIGGEDLFASVNAENQADEKQIELITEGIRTRVGELLKTENVSVLLGAGASIECGGPTLSSIPIEIELELVRRGISCDPNFQLEGWLQLFYNTVHFLSKDNSAPTSSEGIKKRYEKIKNNDDNNNNNMLEVNYEELLSTLHRWSATLSGDVTTLNLNGISNIYVDKTVLEECIIQVTGALVRECLLPKENCMEELTTHRTFMRKLLARSSKLKRVNIFTLNYDTLVEQAADAEGIALFDGFVGTRTRCFRPESYAQDLHYVKEPVDGRVLPYDRVLRLYKLHGSITWKEVAALPNNPYGVEIVRSESELESSSLLIYPATGKYSDSLGMPYAELFRRFATAVAQPQSVLFVIGYGFGDEHVNNIIHQAFAVPSFSLIVVNPKPESPFIKALRKQNDPRVWIAYGKLGKFRNFAEKILPDLMEDNIREIVLKTQKAILEVNQNTKE